MAKPKHVLVTGAAGAVGRVLPVVLSARGHTVRGFDRVAMDEVDGLAERMVGDLTDRAALDDAMRGVDTLIHLAACPNPKDFVDELLEPNVLGLYHTVSAAVDAGVKRIVLASTVQVVTGLRRRGGLIGVDERAPTNDYALTKLWAEDLGAMTARKHGTEVIAVRLGYFPRTAEEAARIRDHGLGYMYLSHDDCRRFFTRAAEATLPEPVEGGPPFHVVYAVSKVPGHALRFDPDPGDRILGYRGMNLFPDGLDFAIG